MRPLSHENPLVSKCGATSRGETRKDGSLAAAAKKMVTGQDASFSSGCFS